MNAPSTMLSPQAQGMNRTALVELDQDHPGFRDPDYRKRRNAIAQLAVDYVEGELCPLVEYTPEEHACWGTIWDKLTPLHNKYAVTEVLQARQAAQLSGDRLPQLREVNSKITPATGFRMLPVAGLVAGDVFLRWLGRGVFLSTQYIRHHSRPLYTPEPDVVHELVGHAMTLIHPEIAALNRLFGEAVADVDDSERLVQILRAYWYTIEFGAVREGDALKVIGAGLLSSFGELARFETEADLRPLDLDACAQRPFDPTAYQNVIYVAGSMADLRSDLTAWLR